MISSMDALVAARARLVALACPLALILFLVGAGSAHAASVVGPGGQISGCYVKKGKSKGTLRVVPRGKRCKKGEKAIAWNGQGQSGQTGAQGGSGEVNVTALLDRVTQLQDRVTQLESILSGLTNGGLLSAITNASKLNGISASDLTGALASVDSLCTEVGTLVVPQLNSVRSALSGLSLGGTIPLGLLLTVPTLPSALDPYACP
jgi:hypothetical protein